MEACCVNVSTNVYKCMTITVYDNSHNSSTFSNFMLITSMLCEIDIAFPLR